MKITVDDLSDLSTAQRVALRALFELHPRCSLFEIATAATRSKFRLKDLLWASELGAESVTPRASTPAEHPLAAKYTRVELRLLSRKLNLPIGYMPKEAMAQGIANMATRYDWTLDTLHLLLTTRAMPQFKLPHDMLDSA